MLKRNHLSNVLIMAATVKKNTKTEEVRQTKEEKWEEGRWEQKICYQNSHLSNETGSQGCDPKTPIRLSNWYRSKDL